MRSEGVSLSHGREQSLMMMSVCGDGIAEEGVRRGGDALRNFKECEREGGAYEAEKVRAGGY